MKNKAYDLIFEDEHYVIVNKFHGILSVPDRYDTKIPNIKHLLARRFQDIFTVHRLDLDTSGLILFAKTQDAHQKMNEIFRNRKILKKYLAICVGGTDNSNFTIDKPVGEHPAKKGQYRVHPKGKEAITHVSIIERFRNYLYAEILIETGRTHQIRVHMQSVGLPVLADSLYGLSDAFYVSSVKTRKFNLGKHEEEQPLLSRQALHALSLTFIHPYSQKKIETEAPLPKDIKACLYQLRKWNAVAQSPD